MAEITCLECNGGGRAQYSIQLPCQACGGSGQMPAEMLRWRAIGSRMKHWRRQVVSRGLREEAEHRGILPSDLCKMENGYIEPILSTEMLNGESLHQPGDATDDWNPLV
jgi:RecJ-like exonuclease